MTNVLFYTDTPEAGGAVNQMYLLAKSLAREKYKVALACGGYFNLDPLVSQFQALNIDVTRLDVSSPRDQKNYTGLKKILDRDTPDLIHLHLSHSGSCRFAFLAAHQMKVPIVTTEHDPFALSFPKHVLKKLALAWTTHTIAVSDDNKEFLRNHYGIAEDKITRVYNGIEVEQYTPSLSPSPIKGEGHGTIGITAVATLHPRKGIKYLIQALPEIIKVEPKIKVNIVGEGEELTTLQALAKELQVSSVITFWGWVPDIKEVLNTTDIFVIPSVREAFGLVALEAMAGQIPVVASEIGGLREIIEDGVSGLLVPPEDPIELAKVIVNLIQNPELRMKIGQGGWERLKTEFTAERMARETEKVYENILRSSL